MTPDDTSDVNRATVEIDGCGFGCGCVLAACAFAIVVYAIVWAVVTLR